MTEVGVFKQLNNPNLNNTEVLDLLLKIQALPVDEPKHAWVQAINNTQIQDKYRSAYFLVFSNRHLNNQRLVDVFKDNSVRKWFTNKTVRNWNMMSMVPMTVDTDNIDHGVYALSQDYFGKDRLFFYNTTTFLTSDDIEKHNYKKDTLLFNASFYPKITYEQLINSSDEQKDYIHTKK